MSNNNDNNNNDPPTPNPLLEAFRSFQTSTPFVTRHLAMVHTISYLSTWFFDLVPFFGNIPRYTLYHMQFHRLVCSPLVGNNSLWGLLVAVFTFQEYGKHFEHGYGSTATLWLCIVLTVASNLFFTFFCWAASMTFQSDHNHPLQQEPDNNNNNNSESSKDETSNISMLDSMIASRMWLIYIGILAVECVRAPPGTRRRFFVTEIPVVYYPLAIYFVFFVLLGGSGGGGLCELLSMAFGYAIGCCARGDDRVPIIWKDFVDRYLLIGSVKSKEWEDRFLQNLTSQHGWVTSQACGSGVWNDIAEGRDQEAGMVINVLFSRAVC